jgi:hypothetical protein
MTATARRTTDLTVPALLAILTLTALGLAMLEQPASAQTSAATKTFANEQYRYSVAMPVGCRHQEGPGTVDAVCSGDFDPERSALVTSAAALVMEVAAEIVAADAGKSATELAQVYGEATFRDELPEAVCGESDKGRAKIANVTQAVQDARVTFAADVVCAEVKFLQIGERRASVRYLIGPDARYRLVARAPTDDFAKQKPAIDAFFDSFQVLPARK